MTIRFIAHFAPLVALFILLSGCGGMMKVQGKVIPGAISYVGVVDQTDPRLAQLGIGGVAIRIDATPVAGGNSTTIVSTTSAADGSFKASIADDVWPSDRVQIRAMLDGYAAARGSVYLPREGQTLLILMERTAAD
ncbi:MAG: hypothetical protein Kow0022_11000 [Phycisphaerales bacterium]